MSQRRFFSNIFNHRYYFASKSEISSNLRHVFKYFVLILVLVSNWAVFHVADLRRLRPQTGQCLISGSLETASADLKTASGDLETALGELETASGSLETALGDLEMASDGLKSASGGLEMASGDLKMASPEGETALVPWHLLADPEDLS